MTGCMLDCVELFIYGDNPDAPIHIWVTASKDGKTKLEGKEPKDRKYIPFYWKTKGVKANLSRIEIGYVVETAIHYIIFEHLTRLIHKLEFLAEYIRRKQ